jgi:hypothetical protein
MTEQEIEDALAALGQELQRLGVQIPVRVLVVGGAFMLTQIHNRPATKDIDVLLIDIDDPSASPLYPLLQAAVRSVAAQQQWPITWFSQPPHGESRKLASTPRGGDARGRLTAAHSFLLMLSAAL